MNATATAIAGEQDLSALAWVHGELRKSLETAHKALRRHLKEAEARGGSDVDAVDPAVLRGARVQLHQGVGALELVGQTAAAQLLRASEAALQRLIAKPALADEAAVATIERASFALLDYLARRLAGKPVSALALFPQYRAVQQLAGADRVHPADLWVNDWSWHELVPDATIAPEQPDEATRSRMESLVLALMRQPDPARARAMSDLCAGLAAGAAGQGRVATLWQLAAAFFEAQAQGLLASDVYSKRIASRLLAQLRISQRGDDAVSERLAQDLLFFCARALPPGSVQAPRLAAARATWALRESDRADYETPRLGRFDPAWIAQARKRLAGAKDAWAGAAAGEAHRFAGLAEQFALVGDSVQRLFPAGEVLAAALQGAVAQTVAAGQAPTPALAMEVATSLLYLDASIEDGELDQPELGGRVGSLASRIDAVRGGAEPAALEGWMEELYRRVSDRQTMGSVVHELRASLSEVEKQIDQYFRDPTQRQVLIPVPAQLSSMRGVLSVLGMEQASQAVLQMRDAVDALAQTEVDAARAAQAGTFDRLADNLGALSFLIDMLGVQPQLAKSVFRFDAETGRLQAVMGRAERAPAADEPPPLLAEAQSLADAARADEVADEAVARQLERLSQQAAAADQPQLARLATSAQRALDSAGDDATRHAVRAELAQAMTELAPPAPAPQPAPVPVPASPVADLEEDPEMREIFIEEAREVVDGARASLEKLADQPDDVNEMTTVRRAFHTLKGSSRMVGLKDYGEAAWACEQLYNARLAREPRVDAPLRGFTHEALDYLRAWTEAIAARRDEGHSSPALTRAADALRLEGRRIAIEVPAASPVAIGAAAAADLAGAPAAVAPQSPSAEPPLLELPALDERVPGLPSAADLDLGPSAAPAPPPATEAGPLDFEFDLAAFDEPATVAPGPRADAAFARGGDMQGAPAEPRASGLAGDEAPGAVPLAAAFAAPDELLPGLFAGADDGEGSGTVPPPATETAETAGAAAGSEPWAVEPAAPVEPSAANVWPPAAFGEASAPAEPPLAPISWPQPEPPLVEADAGGSLAAPAAAAEVAEFDLNEFALDFGLAPAPTGFVPPAPAAEPFGATPPGPGLPGEPIAGPIAEPTPEPTSEPVAEPAAPLAEFEAGTGPAPLAGGDGEQFKVIGELRIGIPLFNIYLNEADEQSRRLVTELAEWALEHERYPVPETAVALAHSLAGNSATVGYRELSTLARALEHALMRSRAGGPGRAEEAALFTAVGDAIRQMLHQFAAGFLRPADRALLESLALHERETPPAPPPAAEPRESAAPAVEPLPLPQITVSQFEPADVERAKRPQASPEAFDDEEDIDAVDAVDAELFPIFEEEGIELLPQLAARLGDWASRPGAEDAAIACMRTLHTFKGGARLAGAMRLGEMAHRLETAIEHLLARGDATGERIEHLYGRVDSMSAAFDALRRAPAVPAPAAEPAPVVFAAAAPTPPASGGAAVPAGFDATVTIEGPVVDRGEPAVAAEALATAATPAAEPLPAAPIDWSRFAVGSAAMVAAIPEAERAPPAAAAVRVRAPLLERLVNQAGEVSITRARIDANVGQLQASLGELTDSLERLRRQLRDIELQADVQIGSRIEAAKAAHLDFDPLEMDRYTRFQELTRFMAESVNDVATLQRSLQRTLQAAEDDLAAQARLTRELQDDLLRTRMVEFESLAERLYRVVRQAAKESGKQVRLDIVGGAIEVDRGVLDRMTAPFEHLLRNSVAHGIERPDERAAAGKDPTGSIAITITQQGNEVGVEVRDDGAGLDAERIRARAVERGLIAPDYVPSETEIANLIFMPGFSTAEAVTELAGRGVGMDVVRAEVNAMGGRIETASARGQGTVFRLVLPLTTAVTQVVMLRCGELSVAVPSTLVETVRRVPADEIERAYASGSIVAGDGSIPFFWLAGLLDAGARGTTQGGTPLVVVVRSAAQRVALHVDEVLGNQEVVVKNVGPQLARLPGLAGVTLLPSGAIVLIYNPVALATLYGDAARARALAGPDMPLPGADETEPPPAPLVLVVDDSLTVRRVTQRLLVREGYRVATAKDGIDALEALALERPAVVLSDIEMPRMDGFDLVRNLRADASLADLPVIMITSRIAPKHRELAASLGVDHYLGKPYAEEELLGLVARYAQTADIPLA